MDETTDPVLDALRDAARVQDVDLDTADIRAVIANLTPTPRRRHPARTALVAAAAVVVVGIGGWQVIATSDGPGRAEPDALVGVELVSARFDAAAARFPLPQGQTYDALRADALADLTDDDEFVRGDGRMPTDQEYVDSLDPVDRATRIEFMTELVARYSGCKWWEYEKSGPGFDALSPREQAEVQAAYRRAGEEVLRVTENPQRIPMVEMWDALCKDAE